MVLVDFIFNLKTPDTGGGDTVHKEGPELRTTVFLRFGQSQIRRGRPENGSDRKARLVIVHVDVRTKRKL